VSSLHSIEQGTIAARPFEHQSGRVSGAHEHQHGRLHASPPASVPLASGTSAAPDTSLVAELGNLIAELSSLSAQAQNLPLSPPSAEQTAPGQGYRPQLTDYSQLTGDVQ
jgi:hypothetical protein